MLVSNIKLNTKEDTCEIQGEVSSSAFKKPFVLWWRFPKACENFLDPNNGDPFVAALLIIAMRVGETLEIQAPISQKLLDNVTEIQRIYRSWDNELSEVAVRAPIRKDDTSLLTKPNEIGLFFSGGVDSSYSLFKNFNDHPNDAESIGYLIMVHGFDIRVGKEDSGHFPAALANCQKIAQSLGKNALPVATNIRNISDRFATWGRLYHGAAIASVGLNLENMFRQLHIAAHYQYDKVIPRGAHPALDPLWSTEFLSFVHDGVEASRLDKVRFISIFPIVLETLRVCWANYNKRYNCGRCEKCLRTMVELHIAGALENCKTFPHSIDIKLLQRIPFVEEDQREFVEELLDALGSSETDLAIKATFEERLSVMSTGNGITMDKTTPMIIFQKNFIKQAIQYYRHHGIKKSLRKIIRVIF